MKKIIASLVAFLLVSSLFAQKQYLDPDTRYLSAKVYQKGVSAFKVKNLKLINDTTIQYSHIDDGERTISTEMIRYVGVKKGTHAAGYGAYGGAVGLLSALYGIMSVKNDPTLDDSGVNWAPFVVGFTVGGAAVGTIVGLFVPKWKIYYAPDKTTSASIVISPAIDGRTYGLGLRAKF